MKYSELKEFSVKDWDGTPFYAICTANPDREIPYMELYILANQLKDHGQLIVGYCHGSWYELKIPWEHAYRIEDNVIKDTEFPMTNLQLIQWLVSGEGLYGRKDGATDDIVLRSDFPCEKKDLKKPVDSSIVLYSFSRETLVKPTVDLLDNRYVIWQKMCYRKD